MNTVPIQDILKDPSASFWLKNALLSALNRDPLDAARDASVLQRVLSDRFLSISGGGK